MFPISLADLSPGTIHHARWLTRANRILRLYVSTLNPSFEFFRIVSYIMNVYIPSWFYFKHHPYCFQGASNLFHSVSLMRTSLNNNELEVVKKVVQHNAHMAHPENILLCAIMDEDEGYRNIAHEKIIEV